MFAFIGVYSTFQWIPGNENKNIEKNKEIKVFRNENIEFAYSEKLFNFNYEIFDTALAGEKDNEVITLSTKNNVNTRLIIKLNQNGLGGGCPGFPNGYKISPILLDGKEVYKAKYMDEKDKYNFNWITGNVYLVQKTDGNYHCPNTAGLLSQKNGSITIAYHIGSGILDPNSYSETEMLFDEVVRSIKGLW